MPIRFSLVLGAMLMLALNARSQTELQKALKDTDVASHWIYDDLPKAFAEAKSTGKPILVVLRCVPCPPGGKLDAAVRKPDADLEKLEKQFVCVRIVQTKGLDLKLFQYDFDMSWNSMFLNADKTIYGRYGTRAGRGTDADAFLSLPSFRKAMERVLELHKGYPGNKSALAGKLGRDPEYRVPEEIPGLQDRAGMETTPRTCIHCHMVKENIIRTKWKEKKLQVGDLFTYPLPNNIGLRMDVDDGLKVKSVAADSPAAKAGLAAGDELLTLNGQPLISIADIQWVLHTVPDDAKLRVEFRRGGQPKDVTIALSGNWRESDISWRASSWFGLRQGLAANPLSVQERTKRGIPDGTLAILVENMYGNSVKPLNAAGLKKGDVIVAIDGKTENMTATQFLTNLRLKHGPEDSIKFTVLRGDTRTDLTIPLW